MEYTVRSTYTRTDSRLRRAADIAVVLLVSALLVFCLFRLVLVPLEVTENSVRELKKGDLALVDRVSKYFADYSLGDILEVRGEDGTEFLGRVAAKAGDTYSVVNGKAYLNGSLIEESEYGGAWSSYKDLEIEVPEDSLLILPDDRGGIYDLSPRIFTYKDVRGEARFLILPFGRFAMFV